MKRRHFFPKTEKKKRMDRFEKWAQVLTVLFSEETDNFVFPNKLGGLETLDFF